MRNEPHITLKTGKLNYKTDTDIYYDITQSKIKTTNESFY